MLRRVEQCERNIEAEEIIVGMNKIIESSAEYFSKVSSSLKTVLTALSTGSVGKIIGKSKSNLFMKRLEEGKKVILVVQTGSLLTRRTAHIIGRVILSMLQSFIGRKYASGAKLKEPLCIYMDEFSNVAYMNIEDLFSKAGGANVYCHAFTQSIADLNDAIGPAKARKILDNTNLKLFMRVNDPETAKYIADYSGTIKTFSPILQTGGTIMIKEGQEAAIMMEDVMHLHEQDFFFFTFNGGFKGRSLTVKPPYLNVKYPELEVC